jgi:hypothetical protein
MESTDMVILQLKIQEGTGKKLPEAKKEVETLANSIVGLAKANKQLREERNKLDIASADGAKRIQELNKLIDENNEKIKQNSSNLEKQRMNVGNYKRGVIDALKELRIGGVNVGDVVDKLSKANEDLFQGMIQGYKQSGIAAKLFGSVARTALTLTGIGVLIAGIVTLIAYWDDIKVAVGLAGTEQERYFKSQQEHLEKSKGLLDRYNESLLHQNELLAIQGGQEQKIFENRRLGLQANLDLQESVLENLRRQIETQERINAITNLGQDLEGLAALKKQYDEASNAVTNTKNQLELLAAELAKFNEDQAKENKEAADKAAADAEKARDDRAKANEKERKEKEKQNEEDRKAKTKQDEEEKERWGGLVEAHFDALEEQSEADKEYHDGLRKLRDETEKAEEEADDREKARRAEAFTAVMQTIDDAQFAANTINAISDAKANREIKRIQELAEQGIISKEKADKQIAQIEKEAFERNKKVSIAQTIIDTIQSAVSAYKAMVGVPIVGPVLAKIAAAVAVATGLAQVAVIRATKFAQGGEFKPKKYSYGGLVVGGRSHAEGGTTYRGEDGNAFEVEKDEGIFILKKSANKEYLSSLNQAHGGKSWGQKTWYAAQGGQIETRDIAARSNQNSAIARIVASALANAPRPVVFVEDIRTGVDRAVSIEQSSRVL